VNSFAARNATVAGVQVMITGAGLADRECAFPGAGRAGDGPFAAAVGMFGVLVRDTARWVIRGSAVFVDQVVVGLVEVLLLGQGWSSSGSRTRGRALGAGRAGVSASARGLARYRPPEGAMAEAWAGVDAAGGLDPVVGILARSVVAKRAAGPHVRVGVRVVGCGAADRAVRGLAWEVATGYALALPRAQLRPRRLRRCARAVTQRRLGRFFWATVEELAALWHVPASPAEFGLPETSARTRPGGKEVPRPRAAGTRRYLPPLVAPAAANGGGGKTTGGYESARQP